MILTLALVALASLLTTLWHNHVHRKREIRSHQELCGHQWTGAIEVAQGTGYGITARMHFYKRFCPACGKQEDVNQDGSPYVPRSKRRD